MWLSLFCECGALRQMHLYIYICTYILYISKYISAIQEFAINSTRRAVPDAPAYGTQSVSLYGNCICRERKRERGKGRESSRMFPRCIYIHIYVRLYMHLGISYMFALIKSEVHFYGLFVNFK